jgi:ATP-dependent Clp protease protease subunit
MAKSEKENRNDSVDSRVQDRIDTALLEQRKIFLADAVGSESAEDIIRKLWYLEYKDPKKPITLYINSPGGSVDSGFAIWDQVKLLSCPVTTVVTGLAASMGAMLMLCASKGRRFATPNSRIMIHQPLIGGVIQGQATDLDIQAKEILKTRAKLVEMLSEATGKKTAVIEKAIDRDTWLSVEEALEFGLLDKIIRTSADLPAHE